VKVRRRPKEADQRLLPVRQPVMPTLPRRSRLERACGWSNDQWLKKAKRCSSITCKTVGSPHRDCGVTGSRGDVDWPRTGRCSPEFIRFVMKLLP
jgi:hypothetical protein